MANRLNYSSREWEHLLDAFLTSRGIPREKRNARVIQEHLVEFQKYLAQERPLRAPID